MFLGDEVHKNPSPMCDPRKAVRCLTSDEIRSVLVRSGKKQFEKVERERILNVVGALVN